MSDYAKMLEVLKSNGFEETGGGNGFGSFTSTESHDVFYVFEDSVKGPEASHWVLVDEGGDTIKCGGFTALTLEAYFIKAGKCV